MKPGLPAFAASRSPMLGLVCVLIADDQARIPPHFMALPGKPGELIIVSISRDEL